MQFKYLFFYFIIHLSCCQDLGINDEKAFKIESYFCITVINSLKEPGYIYNPVLLSGKWTAARYSTKEVQFSNDTKISDQFTICAKKEDNNEYGTVGRFEISYYDHYTGTKYIYIWWDLSLLGEESYGIDYSGSRFVPKRMDRYWFQVYLE